MPKYTLVKIGVNNPLRQTGTVYFVENSTGTKLCTLKCWAFDSCGAWELSSCQNLFGFGISKTAKDIVQFCEDIEDYFRSCYEKCDAYMAHEFYLLLPDKLEENDKMKCVDSYKNKAHGPNTLYLYRVSLLGDFQK